MMRISWCPAAYEAWLGPDELAVHLVAQPDGLGRKACAALLSDLLDEATRAGKAVTIHVEKFNPAMSLYRRLGFAAAGEEGAYDLMRWQPPTL